MSSYLPENHAVNVGNVMFSPISQIEAENARTGKVVRSLDTLAEAEVKAKAKKNSVGRGRPELVAPSKSKIPKNDLAILAAAFVKAFMAMDNGIITQTKEYASMQKLDETEAHIVLQSSTNAINKEKHAEKIAAKIAKYEKQQAKDEKIFGWVMFGLGIALILATVVSAVFTFGASLVALSAETEFEMADLSLTTIDLVGDEEGIAFDAPTDTGELDDTESTDPTNYMGKTAEIMDSTGNPTYENTEEEVTSDLDSSNSKNAKSEESFGKKAAKYLGNKAIHWGAAFGFASPMLWKGISSLKVASGLNKVATAQKNVGIALDALQRNNMYFQFLQQLVQRTGGLIQEEVSDASEVIDTFASITSAYRGIAYGLADAV